MIRHLIKLNWNQKRKNAMLLIEIFVSFIILFAIFSLSLENLKKYRTSLGFDYREVWLLNPEFNQTQNVNKTLQQVQYALREFPEILAVATSEGNIPYSNNSRMSQFEYGFRKVQPQQFAVDDDYKKVLGIEIADGRWFDESDNASPYVTSVINREMQQRLFQDEDPIGKIIIAGRTEYKIIGVVEYFRYRGEFYLNEPSIFERNPLSHPDSHPQCFLIKVKSGTGIEFEEILLKKISAIAKGWTWNIDRLEKIRSNYFLWSLVPLLLLGVICGFLIINVVLGLFGVLWNNISQRRAEIAIRRAVGAYSTKIYQQITGEMLVLATFGIVIGSFFAAQFPLLNVFNVSTPIYISAILLAALSIYFFVTVCTLFPGYLATKIKPATALHDE